MTTTNLGNISTGGGGGGGGSVTSVSGTANRVTIGGTATDPVINIAATYVGQTSITTLGTVTTGTWGAGAVIAGATMTLGSDATGDIYYRNAGGVLTRLGVGANGTVLTVAAGLPSWAAAASAGWGITGNAGTTAGTNYVGTSDAVDFVIKAAATERIRVVNTDGSIQMGGLGALTSGFGTPRLSIQANTNGSSTLNISNTNSGTSARACLVVSGETNVTPSADSRYFTMMVGSTGYTDVPYWANSAVLFSGGGLIGGIKIYPDDGPIQIGTRYTDPSDYPADIWIAPNSLNGVIQTSPVPGSVAIGHKSPIAKLDVLGSVYFHASAIVAGENLFKTAITLPSGSTTSTYANLIDVTGAGSANQLTNALRVRYNSGYTGAGRPVGLQVYNDNAGTGNDLGWATSDTVPFGNGGVVSFTTSTTTGFNYGVWGEGNLGSLNIGVVGKAATAKNSGTNIGVLGQARNTGSSPIEVGGYFTLGAAAPTYASAALMADNADRARDIFVARDNGTACFTVADGGALIATGTTLTFSTNASSIVATGTGANGLVLKNLKNSANTSVSGAVRTVEIDIAGTPYYFLVSPTSSA